MYTLIAAGTLAAMVSWTTLGFPIPATTSDIVKVQEASQQQFAGMEKFAIGTRRIVLGQEYRQLNRDISGLQRKPNKSDEEQKYLSDLKTQREDIKDQMRNLKK